MGPMLKGLLHVTFVSLSLGALVLVLSTNNLYAASFSPSTMTVPFGSRVLSTQIPTVTCVITDGGTAPVLLTSNLISVGKFAVSTTSNEPVLKKTFTMGENLYRIIPLYTQQMLTGTPKKQPQPGDWILGRQKLIPDVSTCQTTLFGAPIPFPVVPTNNYGVSRPLR